MSLNVVDVWPIWAGFILDMPCIFEFSLLTCFQQLPDTHTNIIHIKDVKRQKFHFMATALFII